MRALGTKITGPTCFIGLIAFALSGCKSPMGGSVLQSDGAATCDLGAIEKEIESLGVIAAFQAEDTACLDDGSDTESDTSTDLSANTGANTGANTETNTALASGEAATTVDPAQTEGFALADGNTSRLQLQVVVGWRVMNDLLQAVASEAVNGSAGAIGGGDIERLKAQVQSALAEIRPVLKDLKVTAHGNVIYSYADLYNIVKTNFVDPQVYAYSGPFHRGIHRRYSRGRGIVYNIVARKLAEGLADFDRKAQTELAAFTDGILGVQLQRYEGSLSTAESTFLTLFHNGTIVGRSVAYTEAKELAETARREIPRLLKTPAGEAAVTLASEVIAAQNKCECKVVNGVCGIFKDNRMLFYIPGATYCQSGNVDHCPALRTAAGAQCR